MFDVARRRGLLGQDGGMLDAARRHELRVLTAAKPSLPLLLTAARRDDANPFH